MASTAEKVEPTRTQRSRSGRSSRSEPASRGHRASRGVRVLVWTVVECHAVIQPVESGCGGRLEEWKPGGRRGAQFDFGRRLREAQATTLGESRQRGTATEAQAAVEKLRTREAAGDGAGAGEEGTRSLVIVLAVGCWLRRECAGRVVGSTRQPLRRPQEVKFPSPPTIGHHGGIDHHPPAQRTRPAGRTEASGSSQERTQRGSR